jgi:molybdenum cofactor cytidylyltransferase
LGDTLTPSLIAAVLLHPQGCTRGAPANARVVALLNQADDESRTQAGGELARELLARGVPSEPVFGSVGWQRGAERVVIAALREPGPICKVIAGKAHGKASPDPPVSAIVLAAGEGRRMVSRQAENRLAESSKLALWLGGKSILRHVVEAALASSVNEVVVVLGHRAAQLEQELPCDPRVRAIYNPDYATGQSSSLKAGINAITSPPEAQPRRGSGAPTSQAQAAIFLLGDQPLISTQAIEALVSAFRRRRSALVRPSYRGTPGHPVLFSRTLFLELLQVTGDQGGRELLARHQAEVETIEINLESPIDIDTQKDYSQLRRKFPGLGKL